MEEGYRYRNYYANIKRDIGDYRSAERREYRYQQIGIQD